MKLDFRYKIHKADMLQYQNILAFVRGTHTLLTWILTNASLISWWNHK